MGQSSADQPALPLGNGLELTRFKVGTKDGRKA